LLKTKVKRKKPSDGWIFQIVGTISMVVACKEQTLSSFIKVVATKTRLDDFSR